MIEYIYDVIKASAGEEVTITSKITDDTGQLYTDACTLCLFDGEEKIAVINGAYENEVYCFTIPASMTTGLKGRYWYKVCDCNDISFNFKNPIYFV